MSFRKKLRYKFDNYMSRGPKAMFTALFAITLFFVVVGAVAIYLLTSGNQGPSSFFDSVWWSWLHTSDPGTIAAASYEAPQTTLWYKIVSFIVTVAGIIIFSLLIAFLSTYFEQKLENLQKGKSQVVEKGFTLILGWNDKIFDIIEELVIANENQKKPAIVILSELDKLEMDDTITDRITDRENTRIITRSGISSHFNDLLKVNFNKAKSIILLSKTSAGATEEEKVSSDAEIIKTLLAILYHPQRESKSFNIVTEIYDPKNIDLINSFSDDNVTVINNNEIIAKVMTQTSRQTGLPIVYDELLSFAGCEIYINEYEKVIGKKFNEVYNKFPGGYPIGIEYKTGTVRINPPQDIVINKGDKLIVVAEDDDTCNFAEKLVTPFDSIDGLPSPLTDGSAKEKVLILGHNEKLNNFVKEFEDYTTSGSEMTIVFDFSEELLKELKEQLSHLSKIKMNYVSKDYTNRKTLFELNPFSYDIIIILSRDMQISTMEKSDADTIFTLLVLREIQRKKAPNTKTKIVSEILDIKNKELIETASVNDFIISFKLISMILAQVSEEKDMRKVYEELFREEGSEIYLKPANKYFDNLPLTLNFYQIMDRVYKRDEIAFGYKIHKYENDKSKNYGVKLNPDKDQMITINSDDMIVVIAEDER